MNSILFITAVSFSMFSLHDAQVTVCDVCFCSTTEIRCRNKRLDVIPQGILINTTSLDLSLNKISSIENGSLDGLSSLQTLRLDANKISSLERGDLDGLASLRNLNINRNEVNFIEEGAFLELMSLEELRLQESSIRSICSGTFAELTNLKEIDLEDNENTMECCEVQRFIRWIQQNPSIKVGGKCKHQSNSTVIQTFTVTECPPPVYGCWTYFGPWGACSTTCGGGQQSRTRTCTNPPPAHGGDECQGSYQQIKSCQEQHCPGTREWGNKGKRWWYNLLFNFFKQIW